MRYEVGSLVVSLAGHDKGELFIIYKECGEYVYLTDGRSRGLDRPKRKNKKHIQVTHKKDGDISSRLARGEDITDEMVKRFIRVCRREMRFPGGEEHV